MSTDRLAFVPSDQRNRARDECRVAAVGGEEVPGTRGRCLAALLGSEVRAFAAPLFWSSAGAVRCPPAGKLH